MPGRLFACLSVGMFPLLEQAGELQNIIIIYELVFSVFPLG